MVSIGLVPGTATFPRVDACTIVLPLAEGVPGLLSLIVRVRVSPSIDAAIPLPKFSFLLVILVVLCIVPGLLRVKIKCKLHWFGVWFAEYVHLAG